MNISSLSSFSLQCCYNSVTWQPWGGVWAWAPWQHNHRRVKAISELDQWWHPPLLEWHPRKVLPRVIRAHFQASVISLMPGMNLSLHFYFVHRLSVDLGYAETGSGAAELKCVCTNLFQSKKSWYSLMQCVHWMNIFVSFKIMPTPSSVSLNTKTSSRFYTVSTLP